jgi:hypothetical protein
MAMAAGETDSEDDEMTETPTEIRPRPYTKLDEIRAHCVIDEQPFWLVEEIKDVRMDAKGKIFYLVKWVGYLENDNSWEPEENCNLARRLIAEFHQKSSNKTSNLARQILQSSKPPASPPPKPANAKKQVTKMKVNRKSDDDVTAAKPYERKKSASKRSIESSSSTISDD